jgi:TolB-like protein
MKNILLFLALFIFAHSQEKSNIAVIDLIGRGITDYEAQTLSDKLRGELINTGKYVVVERGQMANILKEQGFQRTGACDDKSCMVEMGQLLGVKYMVAGSIGKIEQTYLISIRMIDVGKGNIVTNVEEEITGSLTDVLKVGIYNAARKLAGLEPDKKVTARPAPPPAPVPTVQRTPAGPPVPMGRAEVLFNVLGFLQFGPMFEAGVNMGNDLFLTAHARFATMGLVYQALVSDGFQGEVTGGMAFGAGLAKFFSRSILSRPYVAAAMEYGWGSNRGDVGTQWEWEGDHSYMVIYGNGGYRWRFPSKFFVNLGGLFGFVISLSDEWYYINDPTDVREGDNLSLLFAMLEFSIGMEF